MRKHSPLTAGAPCGLALFSVALAGPAFAQLPRADQQPLSLAQSLSPDLPRISLTAPAAEGWLLDHPAEALPLRYGEPLPVDLDLTSAGRWSTTADGALILQIEILSPGAKSLGLEFGRFDLPAEAALFVHDGRGGAWLGAFGEHNESASGDLAVQPLRGERLVIELNLPAGTSDQVALELSRVVHDYRDVYGIPVGGSGTEGGCLIDVNCSEGNPWRKQQRAVVRTLSGGALCSAVLVNNTAVNLIPYVLTASHCGQSTNTIFLFNYETAGCGTGSAPENQSLSGCAVLGNDALNDERFLRINNNVPASFHPYYAGWSRETSNTWYAVSIGHPAGGPKKISIDSTATQKQPNRWQVGWSAGMLLGGSSGGPLFDALGRVRGNACCVNGFDCNQLAWFGRVDQFWWTNDLAQWLAPVGPAPLTLDGFDPDDPLNLLGNGGVGPGPGGGSSGPPQIAAVNPPSLPAVSIDAPAILTLTGSGFNGTTSVSVDGVPLLDFPPQFTVVSDSELRVQIFPQQSLGPIEILVTDSQGSDSASVQILPNSSPTLDLGQSDPGFLVQLVGLEMWVGSSPGDLVFFLASPSNQPTLLPGLVDLDMGAGATQLFLLSSGTVSATSGYAYYKQPLSGNMPLGLKLYVQAAVFELASGTFPLTATNLQVGTILF